MSEFRNSTIEELYGPSKFTEPPILGQIDWKQVGVFSAIAVVVVGVPVVWVYVITKRRQEELVEKIEQKHEEAIARLKREQEERNETIVKELFEREMGLFRSKKQA